MSSLWSTPILDALNKNNNDDKVAAQVGFPRRLRSIHRSVPFCNRMLIQN